MLAAEEATREIIGNNHQYKVFSMVKKTNIPGVWQCAECGISLSCKSQTINHVEIKHINDPTAHTCKYCFKQVRSINALRIHTTRFHKVEHRMNKIHRQMTS